MHYLLFQVQFNVKAILMWAQYITIIIIIIILILSAGRDVVDNVLITLSLIYDTHKLKFIEVSVHSWQLQGWVAWQRLASGLAW